MTLIKENPILKECPGQQQYKQKTCINYNKHKKLFSLKYSQLKK